MVCTCCTLTLLFVRTPRLAWQLVIGDDCPLCPTLLHVAFVSHHGFIYHLRSDGTRCCHNHQGCKWCSSSAALVCTAHVPCPFYADQRSIGVLRSVSVCCSLPFSCLLLAQGTVAGRHLFPALRMNTALGTLVWNFWTHARERATSNCSGIVKIARDLRKEAVLKQLGVNLLVISFGGLIHRVASTTQPLLSIRTRRCSTAAASPDRANAITSQQVRAGGSVRRLPPACWFA